jgi:hypothetical protein
MTKKYYHTETFQIVDIEELVYDSWISSNNLKAQIYQPLPPQPSYNEETQRIEWGDAGWNVIDLTQEEIAAKTRKIWETKADFWNEFTSSEQLDIMDSTIPDIRLLDRQLIVWSGEIWSDDERVLNGLNALVITGIITDQRKAEILNRFSI